MIPKVMVSVLVELGITVANWNQPYLDVFFRDLVKYVHAETVIKHAFDDPEARLCLEPLLFINCCINLCKKLHTFLLQHQFNRMVSVRVGHLQIAERLIRQIGFERKIISLLLRSECGYVDFLPARLWNSWPDGLSDSIWIRRCNLRSRHVVALYILEAYSPVIFFFINFTITLARVFL